MECRRPDSVHNTKVFCNSKINKDLQNEKLPITQQILIGCQKVGNYLIGDPTYPLAPCCLREYSTCFWNADAVSNNMPRSSCSPMECASGGLKACFGFLTRVIDLQLENVPVVIFSCFVLHNFCQMNQCYVDPDLVQKQADLHKKSEKEFTNIPYPVYSMTQEQGEVRRILTKDIQDQLSDDLVGGS